MAKKKVIRSSGRVANMKSAEKDLMKKVQVKTRARSKKTNKDHVNSFKEIDQDVSFKIERKCSRKDALNSSVQLNTSYRQFADASFSTPDTGGPKSVDFYDFEEDDDFLPIRLDLSPIKADEKSPRISKSGNKGVKRKRKSVEQSGSAAKRKQMEKTKNELNKKSTPILSTTSGSRKGKQTPVNKEAEDSGVFMTPASFLTNDAVSTPSETSPRKPLQDKQNKSEKASSGQQPSRKRAKRSPNGLPDSPMLSPVQKVSSPGIQGALVTSQCGMVEDIVECSVSELVPSTAAQDTTPEVLINNSLAVYTETKRLSVQPDINEGDESEEYHTLDISKTYSGLGYGYFDRSIEKKKTKDKKTKKQKRQSVSRYDVIADEINQEFDDLENFEFSMD